MLPLIVVVTGTRDEEIFQAAQTLQSAVPQATVRPHVRAEESLAEASARSHLVLNVSDRDDPLHSGLWDATVSPSSELESFGSRMRDFDRRRRLHELPPDLVPSIAPWSAAWAHSARRIEHG